MPIYAYRCGACGYTQDILQKINDPLRTDCPACGQSTFAKQVTAAGFQLKGSGWYVTDFRGKSQAAEAITSQTDAAAATTTTATDSTSSAAPAKPVNTPANNIAQ